MQAQSRPKELVAYDSGARVIIVLLPELDRIRLAIGESIDDDGNAQGVSVLTVSDAERVVEGLGKALAQLRALHRSAAQSP